MLRERTLTDDGLHSVLERARAVGFLGPGPLSVHAQHARRYAGALAEDVRTIVDIGSGGGLPGIPIALARPELRVTLLDAAQKRTAFLLWAAIELGLSDRVTVVTARAEDHGRDPEARRSFDAVVSRGFGPPGLTLECAAGLVRTNGEILISEPPEARAWPADELAQLGLELVSSRSDGDDVPIAVFRAVAELDNSFPRSAKAMKRDPLF